MGWETDLITSISFNRETYQTKYQVEEDLKDVKQSIQDIKRYISDFAMMTEPEKFMPKDENNETSPFEWVHGTLDSLFEELDGYYYDKVKLEILLEDWDKCHTKDGKPIIPKGKMRKVLYGNIAYIDGDFIGGGVDDEGNPIENGTDLDDENE